MKPATALPLTFLPDEGNFIVDARGNIAAEIPCQGVENDKELGTYIVHAANNYPRLVQALKDLALRCDGEEGVRADGSNIQTMAAWGVLRELGESS